MTVITKSEKGSPLTHSEMDSNFQELRDIPDGQVFPKASSKGIKIDTLAPDWGWHDIHGDLTIDVGDPLAPNRSVYNGSVKQWQYAENDEGTYAFHLPHDYAMGTDIYMHVHWSLNSPSVIGGTVTWAFEMFYAKGHGQGVFGNPKTYSIVGAASPTQYSHEVTEGAVSITGGSGTQLNTADLEPDSVLICRFYLDSNDITDSVAKPNPFVHFVDIHYQTTGIPTKNKSPDFWT